MEECIYNFLPVPVEVPVKPPRYISTFRPRVKFELAEKRTAPCKSMGLPKLQVPSPKDFLRKHSKEPKLPKRTRHQGTMKPREPSVPRRTEHPLMGIQGEKDFISTNAAQAVMAVAKKPLRACVDMRRGDRFLIDDSGLVKKYLKKKDFGITPKYITNRTKAAERAQEESVVYAREALRRKAPRRISKEERETLLEGLKTNWEQINKEFQSLSVVTDTIPKKLNKEKLELQMKELEHYISTIEKHKFIYVTND
ncbi:enkurin-like isoform X2 [Hemicordylus capensis]|nr:enkurin-like isoform X2 [Hemicordylus capensis]XP_053116382.1 enkurin-like isoform X2 [Hemicordylus capensis]